MLPSLFGGKRRHGADGDDDGEDDDDDDDAEFECAAVLYGHSQDVKSVWETRPVRPAWM